MPSKDPSLRGGSCLLDVHRIANRIAQRVEGDRGDKDHDPGQDHNARIDVDRRSKRVQHVAPFGRRRTRAQTQEARLEAMIMLSPTRPAAYTKIGLKIFGRSCVKMIDGVEAPLNR